MKTESRSTSCLDVKTLCAILAAGVLGVSSVVAQTPAAAPAAKPVVYPSKGQSAEQQKKDTSECYAWSTQQTGYDPAAEIQAQQAAAQQSQQNAQAAQAQAGAVGGERAAMARVAQRKA